MATKKVTPYSAAVGFRRAARCIRVRIAKPKGRSVLHSEDCSNLPEPSFNQEDSIPGWDAKSTVVLSKSAKDEFFADLKKPPEPTEALMRGMKGYWDKVGR